MQPLPAVEGLDGQTVAVRVERLTTEPAFDFDVPAVAAMPIDVCSCGDVTTATITGTAASTEQPILAMPGQQAYSAAPDLTVAVDSNGAVSTASFEDSDTLVSKRYPSQALAEHTQSASMVTGAFINSTVTGNGSLHRPTACVQTNPDTLNTLVGSDWASAGPITPILPYRPLQFQPTPIIPHEPPWLQAPHLNSGTRWEAAANPVCVDSSSANIFVDASLAMSEEDAMAAAMLLSELSGLALDPQICRDVLTGAGNDMEKATGGTCFVNLTPYTCPVQNFLFLIYRHQCCLMEIRDVCTMPC